MRLIHLLPPETAHGLGIFALRHRLLPSAPPFTHDALAVDALGLRFPNPIGLAAGFDKNAAAVDALLGQGFGFVEAGTVTPLPQPGNPRPRVFRLIPDEAVINRLGFNNEGLEAFVRNFGRHDRARGVAGANIGKNKESAAAAADYVRGLEAVYPLADYVTVNVSSPNTEGLRALQKREALEGLLGALMTARAVCERSHGRRVPLLLKVAPDLGEGERRDVVEVVLALGIDALVISNTTIARPPSLKSRHAHEQGGLSGKPLFAPSTQMLGEFYRLTGGKIPLIGVGGIFSGADAYAKIRAGATLVQLYTALAYRGFGMVHAMKKELLALLQKDGFSHVQQAVGADHRSASSLASQERTVTS